MWVKEIWRYPVKSTAGEQRHSARLTPSGIDGDRVVQIQNAAGRPLLVGVDSRPADIVMAERAERR
jgi:uncharacterized protein YcbX